MSSLNWKPLLEVAKEALRWSFIVGVSAIVAALLDKVVSLPQTETTVLLSAVLRLVDKALHEWGKSQSTRKEESWAVKGLTRF